MWHGLPARENTAKMAVPPGMNYLDGRSDHRIVMALSIAGLGLDKAVTIDTAEAMKVTFPDYVKLMKSIGADMELVSA